MVNTQTIVYPLTYVGNLFFKLSAKINDYMSGYCENDLLNAG